MNGRQISFEVQVLQDKRWVLQEVIGECLAKGVAEGDVDPNVPIQEIVDLLLAAYVWVYRLAAWKSATAAEMTKVMDRQIGLIAAGFAVR